MSERFNWNEYRITIDMNADYEIHIIDDEDNMEMYFSLDDFAEVSHMILNR